MYSVPPIEGLVHTATIGSLPLIAFIATTRRPFPRGTSSVLRTRKLIDHQFTIVGAPLGQQVSLIKSTETRPNSGLRWFRYVGVELQARDPLSSDRNHLRDLRDWAHTQELVLITSWLYIVCILTGFFRADHSIFLITCKPLSPFPSRLNPQPPSPNSCSTNS